MKRIMYVGLLTMAIAGMSGSRAEGALVFCRKGTKTKISVRETCKPSETPIAQTPPTLQCEVVPAYVLDIFELNEGVYYFSTDPCPAGTLLTGGGFHFRDDPSADLTPLANTGFAFVGSKRKQPAEGQPATQWSCSFYTPGNIHLGVECFAHCCSVSPGE